MTRSPVLLVVFSAAAVAFAPGQIRAAGLGGLAFAGLFIAYRTGHWARRRAARRTLEGLRALHPDDFEAEVGRWLRRDGWRIEHRGGTGDGGIDIVARRRGETLAVQCKRYAESAAVGASHVRDLYGAAVAEGATGALLVTTGRVSGPAIAWAEALRGEVWVAFHDRECLGEVAAGRARM